MTKEKMYKMIRKTLHTLFGYCPPKNHIEIVGYGDDYIIFIVGKRHYELNFYFDIVDYCFTPSLTIEDFYGYGHDLHLTSDIVWIY